MTRVNHYCSFGERLLMVKFIVSEEEGRGSNCEGRRTKDELRGSKFEVRIARFEVRS